MGIDPGTNFMGYAIIKVFGKNQKPELVVSGIVDMIKITDPYIKLQRIFSRTLQVIDSYQPDELAIEAQFYGKNVQSMLKLGRAHIRKLTLYAISAAKSCTFRCAICSPPTKRSTESSARMTTSAITSRSTLFLSMSST